MYTWQCLHFNWAETKKTSFGSLSFVAVSCKPNITKYLCVGELSGAESGNWSKQENFKFNFRKFYLYFHEYSLDTNFVLWSFGHKIMPSKYFVKSLRGKIWHLLLKVWSLKILNKKFKHQKRWAQPIQDQTRFWKLCKKSIRLQSTFTNFKKGFVQGRKVVLKVGLVGDRRQETGVEFWWAASGRPPRLVQHCTPHQSNVHSR